MKDVQLEPSPNSVDIDHVGIKNLRYPVTVLDKNRGEQHTVADVQFSVDLPHRYRGTHMSRFLEILHENHKALDIRQFRQILRETKHRLNSSAAAIKIRFPYFVEKTAPVTGMAGMMDYLCGFQGVIDADGKETYTLSVSVPVTTVCPCSKEISDRGAHNQRGQILVKVRYNEMIWLEDLITLVEECGSCELFAVLKRPDEKYVTERSFDNPVFVEDVVRGVAGKLKDHPRVTWFRVEAETSESIHNHSAYAVVEFQK